METLQQAIEQQKAQLRGKLSASRRLSPQEYEAVKERTYRANYTGICRPDCPICGGVGRIAVNPEAGIRDPEFGKTKLCPNADFIKAYGNSMGLDQQEIKSLKWDMVKNLGNAGKAEDAVRETLERGFGWVTLWGNYGLAKSLILRIAIAESLRGGKLAAFVEMTRMLDDLRQAFDDPNSNLESVRRLEKWQEIPVLAVDEIDKINKTEWAKEREFAIFNFRYQMAIREQSITFYASNQSPATIGGALGDRMLDGRFKVIKLEGPSNRPSIREGQDY